MSSSLKNIIEQRMQRPGWGPFDILLYFLSLAYGLGVWIRLRLYGIGVLRKRSLDKCRVISIGNVTVGGSGKTPMAIYVAELIKRQGGRVAVISRGYGRATSGILTVSDGKNILAQPKDAGDEPYLMATRLKGMPVIVGEDRVKAGRFAIKEFNCDCIILDDGFQHMRLKRDIDILLVDASTGFGNGFLLPRGILREPISAVNRASIIMIKDNRLEAKTKELIKSAKKPAMNFNYKPTALARLDSGQTLQIADLKRRRVVAVAGIANPESFFSTLKGLQANVVQTCVFNDHHAYNDTDVKRIETIRKASNAEMIVTTEKDGVKLKGLAAGAPDIFVLSVDAVIENKKEFEKLISALLKEGR